MERKAPPKPGRRRDEIWKYVEKLSEGYFTCNFCRISYKGGASRIRSHLYGLKGGGIRACPESHLRTKNKNPKLADTTSNSLEMIPSPNNPTQSSSSFANENRNKVLDNMIVQFLSSNKLPLETIEQPCFRNLLDMVAGVGPRYELPTNCSNLYNDSLPFVNDVLQYVQMVCNSLSTFGCTLIVNLEPEVELIYEFDKRQDGSKLINGFSMYSPEGVVFTNTLDPSHPYAESQFLQLFREINAAIARYCIMVICADAKIVKKFRNIWYYMFSHTRCFWIFSCATQHILTLLSDMSEEYDWGYEEYDWGSSSGLWIEYEYDLLKGQPESLTKQRDEKAWEKYDHAFFKLQAVLQHKTDLDHESREEGIKLLSAVGPLVHMLSVFDNFVPNIGYFYGAILKAEFRLKHFFDLQPQDYKKLWELFTKFKGEVLKDIHKVAAYLNPGYMLYNINLLPHDMNKRSCEYFDYLFPETQKKRYFDDEYDTATLEGEIDLYNKKDPSLFSEEAISMLQKYHTVVWWQKFGGTVPLLQGAAIRLLSQRVNRLSQFSHKYLYFKSESDLLSMNAFMMDEFRKFNESDEIFKPIDLSILDTPLIEQ